jgi:hypothetical protein
MNEAAMVDNALAVVLRGAASQETSRSCRLICSALRMRPASFCTKIIDSSHRLFLVCIDLLSRDTELQHRDEYVNLITTLRFQVRDKHAANTLLLPHSQLLLTICMEALQEEPGGFAGLCCLPACYLRLNERELI